MERLREKEEAAVEELGTQLELHCTRQPIDDVQLYFGTKIAIYFAFVGMYTRFTCCFLRSLQFPVHHVFFIIVMSWAVFFFQFWKRKNFALLTRWQISYTIETGPGFKILGMEWSPLQYPMELDHGKEKQIYQRHEWFARIRRFRNDAIIILSIICLQLPFELAYAHLYEKVESGAIKEDAGWFHFSFIEKPQLTISRITSLLLRISRSLLVLMEL